MARPIEQRVVDNPLSFPPSDDQKTVPIPLFTIPSGMNTAKSLGNIDNNTTPYCKNLIIDQGKIFATRVGTVNLGSASPNRVLAAYLYRNSTSAEYIIRVTVSSIDFWDGVVWNTMTDNSPVGNKLSLSIFDYVSITAWGTYLMVMTSIGMYQVDLSVATFAWVSTAPAAKTVTTFGSRLVVSHVYGGGTAQTTRIQWSVKNNSDDWTGLGSGFEDLLAAPGGVNDIEHGVFPINDYEAFVVRSGSIWLMTLTGQFDTPFAFTYLFGQGQIQCDSPYSIAAVPGGVILLCRDNIYYVTRQQVTPIGDSIRSLILTSAGYNRRAVGVYDSNLNEYRLTILQKVFSGQQPVYRYNLSKECWTVDYYPYQIRHLSSAIYEQSSSIGSLVGTIGSLTGPIGELGLNNLTRSFLFVEDAFGYVTREQDGLTTDFSPIAGIVNIPIELRTGMITASNILDKVEVQEQQLVVQSSQAQSLDVDYSRDGITWTHYSTAAVVVTGFPRPYRMLKPISREQLQLRLISSNGGGMRLSAWFVMAQKGARLFQ